MSDWTLARGAGVNYTLPRMLVLGMVFFVAVIIALLTTGASNQIVVIAAALALPFIAAIFIKPELGLLLLIFATYTRLFEVVLSENEGVLSAYTAYLGFLAGVLLVRRVFLDEKVEGWKTAALLFGAFGGMALASMLYARYPATSARELVIFIKDALMALIVVVMMRRASVLHHAVWALLAAGIFLGTIAVYQQFTGTFDNTFGGFGEARYQNIFDKVQGARIGGPGLDPNTYGQFMLILVPLAWDRMLSSRRWWLRTLGGYAFAVSALSIIFSFSRGNFIGLVFVLVLMLAQHPPRFSIFISGLILVALMVPFIPPQYTERLITLRYIIPDLGGTGDVPEFRQATKEISFRGRLSENLVGLLMTRDNPILGVGYGNFKENYQSYSRGLGLDPRREPRSAHNLFLEISSEFGVMGLIWFIALQAVVFGGLLRARNHFLKLGMRDFAGIHAAYMVSIAGLLITSVFLHMVYPRYFWFIYAMALAIPHAAANELDHSFLENGLKDVSHDPVQRNDVQEEFDTEIGHV